MLHLHHHLSLPHLTNSKEVVLSPVASEQDELIQAIEADRGEQWTLEAAPDVQELDQFWTEVQEDLEKDPNWFKFADTDE